MGDNIKMDPGLTVLNRIHVTQERDRWRDVVKIVMNLPVT